MQLIPNRGRSRKYAVERYSFFHEIEVYDREMMSCRTSADTILFLRSIVHCYSLRICLQKWRRRIASVTQLGMAARAVDRGGRWLGDLTVTLCAQKVGESFPWFLRDTRPLGQSLSLHFLIHHQSSRVQQITGHAARIIFDITITFRQLHH